MDNAVDKTSCFKAMKKYSCWDFAKAKKFPRVWKGIRKETSQCQIFELPVVNLLYAEEQKDERNGGSYMLDMFWSCCSRIGR